MCVATFAGCSAAACLQPWGWACVAKAVVPPRDHDMASSHLHEQSWMPFMMHPQCVRMGKSMSQLPTGLRLFHLVLHCPT